MTFPNYLSHSLKALRGKLRDETSWLPIECRSQDFPPTPTDFSSADAFCGCNKRSKSIQRHFARISGQSGGKGKSFQPLTSGAVTHASGQLKEAPSSS